MRRVLGRKMRAYYGGHRLGDRSLCIRVDGYGEVFCFVYVFLLFPSGVLKHA